MMKLIHLKTLRDDIFDKSYSTVLDQLTEAFYQTLSGRDQLLQTNQAFLKSFTKNWKKKKIHKFIQELVIQTHIQIKIKIKIKLVKIDENYTWWKMQMQFPAWWRISLTHGDDWWGVKIRLGMNK